MILLSMLHPHFVLGIHFPEMSSITVPSGHIQPSTHSSLHGERGEARSEHVRTHEEPQST